MITKQIHTAIYTVALLLLPQAGHAIDMSGLILFSTDDSGSTFSNDVWNTASGDTVWNLWLTDGAIGGPELNGPSSAQAGIDVSLSDGIHTFTILGEGEDVTVETYHGLNIFFNGANTSPGISVFAATDTSLFGDDPPFFAANGISRPLLPQTSPQVAAAGSLTFVDGLTTVTLTSFRWSEPDVGNIDLVSKNSRPAGLQTDFIGEFTLRVETVPEPSAMMLGAFAVMGMFLPRRSRRVA